MPYPRLSAVALKQDPLLSRPPSSKLLSQEFVAAPQPVPALVPQPAAAPATTISGYSSAASLYSGCCPYGAPFPAARAQGVPAMRTVAAHVLPVPAPVSPATSGSHQHSSLCDASATAVAPLLAASRAASPEPDWRDEEAVRLAGLALQLSQGDASQAMSHLLAWAAAH